MKILFVMLLGGVMTLGMACDDEGGTTPATDTGPATDSGGGSDATSAGLPADIAAIFEAKCVPCHNAGATPFVTDHSTLGNAAAGTTYTACAGKTVAECTAILAGNGEMPAGSNCSPEAGGNCPTQDEVDALNAWVAAGAAH